MFNKKFIFNISVLLLIVANILHRIFSEELRLDEFGSLWVIQDTWSNIFKRWQFGHGQSVLFSVITWSIKNYISESIYILRLFSFTLFLASAYCLFKIAELIYDRPRAFFSSFLFLSFYEVTYFASEIRSYPLAMFFFLFSSYLLIRCLIDRNLKKLFAYPFTLAAMVYCQPLFIQVLPLHLLILFFASKENLSKNYLIKISTAYLIFIILLLPLKRYLINLGSASKFLATGLSMNSPIFLNEIGLIICEFVFLLILLVCFRFTIYRDEIKFKINNMVLTKWDFLIIVWFLSSFIFSIVYNLITGFSVFLPKYYLPYLPAKALLLLIIIQKFVSPTKSRSAIQQMFLIFCIIVTGTVVWKDDFIPCAWGRAVEIVKTYNQKEICPVIFHSGYVEHKNIAWLKDPEVSSFISYPYRYYNLENDFKLLPGICSPEVQSYYQQELSPFVEAAKKCVWVGNFGDPFLEECFYLKDILVNNLFIKTTEYKIGNEILVLYTKNN